MEKGILQKIKFMTVTFSFIMIFSGVNGQIVTEDTVTVYDN